MSPSQVKAMVDGLVDRLPDAPRDAVIVATYLLANVAVCTGCTDAQATEALARALDQMRRAKR